MRDYLKQVYRLPFYLDLKWNDDYTLYMYILLAAFCDVSFFFLKEALREQKSRREHQVTMYRKYRKGDLPDIQIKYSYIIAPLQAVAHVSIQRVIYNVSDIQINYSHRFYHLTINIFLGAAPHSVQHIYLIFEIFNMLSLYQ